MRRWAILIAAAGLLEGVPLALADCPNAQVISRAPEGGESLSVCRRPLPFAMPGQGSDAPGWLLQRDAAGWVRGIVTLGIARTATEFDAIWAADRVSISLHADLPRAEPAATPLAYVTDRSWRWRALLGLAPSDEDFR